MSPLSGDIVDLLRPLQGFREHAAKDRHVISALVENQSRIAVEYLRWTHLVRISSPWGYTRVIKASDHETIRKTIVSVINTRTADVKYLKNNVPIVPDTSPNVYSLTVDNNLVVVVFHEHDTMVASTSGACYNFHQGKAGWLSSGPIEYAYNKEARDDITAIADAVREDVLQHIDRRNDLHPGEVHFLKSIYSGGGK